MKMNLPWIESPFFEQIIASKNLSKDVENIAREYHTKGFAVIKNAYTEAEIEQVKQEMDNKGFNPDFPYVHQRDERRCQDLWDYSEPVRQFSCKENIISILETLYDRETIPFQTLNFKFGSQQRAHSDTIHFSSLPARFMCGVWVALEDINEENGPLFYYPGSHKTKEFNFNDFRDDLLDNSYDNYIQYEDFMEEFLKVSHFQREIFKAQKGDALIWSSNIVHGGMPVLKQGSTRYSQVTHYFFKDCIYYQPMGSNTITGELAIRLNLKNLRTKKAEKFTYNGYETKLIRSYRRLYLINHHIFYPSIFRFFTDIIFILKNHGISKLWGLVSNKLGIKKKV
ncbi:MAG: hypothetical protein RJA76_881 [Bacteroidota bacterium]|jgi:ectoine hydroxylase-related dioxygenase (phytanoyl-CoA dioxygenase family)